MSIAKLIIAILLFIPILTLGGEVRVPPRVITSSPALTELIFQLGFGDSLVGVSAYSQFPEQATKLPVIGNFFYPQFDRILRLKPDWVLMDANASNAIVDQALAALKIRVLNIKVSSVAELFRESKNISELVFLQSSNKKLDEMESYWTSQQPLKPFRFLALAWLDPMIAFGSTTFVANVLESRGGVNQLKPSIRVPYPQLSAEWVISNRPEVLFLLEESASNRRAVEAKIRFWFGDRAPKVIYLSSSKWARTNFTALESFPDLLSQLEGKKVE